MREQISGRLSYLGLYLIKTECTMARCKIQLKKKFFVVKPDGLLPSEAIAAAASS